jgi:hypothetical protein
MENWTAGDRIEHVNKPDWGVGKVIEVRQSDKIDVFFPDAKRAKPMTFNGSAEFLVRSENDEPLPLLDNLSFEAVQKGSFLSLEHAKQQFLEAYPGGFSGEFYISQERGYKLKACALMEELLSREELQRLIDTGGFEEIRDRAKKVIQGTNLIFPNEKMALTDALKIDGNLEPFATSLFTLLYADAPLQDRFTQYSSFLKKLQASKWTTASYFLFLSNPDECMFVKPTVTKDAAVLCGYDILYTPDVNWNTYRAILGLSSYLNGVLAELNPKDMIDVQSFMWCIAQKKPGCEKSQY